MPKRASKPSKPRPRPRPNPSNGIKTIAWGPSLWRYLHCAAQNYPRSPTTAQKKNYVRFLKTLGKTLPCGACRRNYPKNLKSALCRGHSTLTYNTPCMRNRSSFKRFVWRLHTAVNKCIKKKKKNPSFSSVDAYYEKFRAGDCNTKTCR